MKILSNEIFDLFFRESNPTLLGTHINKLAQKLFFYEHPLKGDSAPVYCLITDIDLNVLAFINTGFYDLSDMKQEHGEYTPLYIDGKVVLGYEVD